MKKQIKNELELAVKEGRHCLPVMVNLVAEVKAGDDWYESLLEDLDFNSIVSTSADDLKTLSNPHDASFRGVRRYMGRNVYKYDMYGSIDIIYDAEAEEWEFAEETLRLGYCDFLMFYIEDDLSTEDETCGSYSITAIAHDVDEARKAVALRLANDEELPEGSFARFGQNGSRWYLSIYDGKPSLHNLIRNYEITDDARFNSNPDYWDYEVAVFEK